VIAMGDSLNDIAMIRAAGLGVAMGNAQDEVKKAADVITGTNHENGVAQIIQKYILAQS
jgi:5-amino-6-(5-phospho-D-ribitylamino)uracil phosphatase